MFCHLCILLLMFYHLWADVSSSHMFVILLWSSISLSGVMFYHPCLVFHHLIWYFATMPDVSSSFLIFCDTMRCFATFLDVSSSCLMFCYHFWYLLVLSDVSPSYLMLVVLPDVLTICACCFCFLIIKHKPTEKREPNYGCSDSFHGIRRRRFLWGLIEHIFVNIPFFSPHFVFSFFFMHLAL